MTTQQLVDRGLQVVAKIKECEDELKEIEALLEKKALNGEHQELKDSDREGRQFLAHGSKLIVPIIFTADKIVSSFKENGDVHKTIRLAAGDELGTFFKRTVYYENTHKDGKAFRKTAIEILGAVKGPELVSASLAKDKHGIPKSDTKINWSKAEPIKE